MTREHGKICRAEVMKSLSTMDERSVAEEAFNAVEEIKEAMKNVTRIIQEKRNYLVATNFSMVVAVGCLGTPDAHNPGRTEPDTDNDIGIVPISFVVGTKENCIALTNILTVKIFDVSKGGQ